MEGDVERVGIIVFCSEDVGDFVDRGAMDKLGAVLGQAEDGVLDNLQ